jgi:hypothetical protein
MCCGYCKYRKCRKYSFVLYILPIYCIAIQKSEYKIKVFAYFKISKPRSISEIYECFQGRPIMWGLCVIFFLCSLTFPMLLFSVINIANYEILTPFTFTKIFVYARNKLQMFLMSFHVFRSKFGNETVTFCHD